MKLAGSARLFPLRNPPVVVAAMVACELKPPEVISASSPVRVGTPTRTEQSAALHCI